MSMMSATSETPALQDYVRPVNASLDSGKTNEKKKSHPMLSAMCFVMLGIAISTFILESLDTKLRHCITNAENVRF